MGETDQWESEAHQRYWCWEQVGEHAGEHAGGQASDQVGDQVIDQVSDQVIVQATQVQRLVKVM